jgi:histo-blood group ABO system transferase
MVRTYLACVAGGSAYKDYAYKLMASARIHFKPSERISYCILDGVEGWPNGTLFRYNALFSQINPKDDDYVFLCDADMRFEGDVSSEILPKEGLAATAHPGYVSSPPMLLPYERRMNSRAYVSPNEGGHYYAGGFIGGKASAMRALADWVMTNVWLDIGDGLIAKWHDESHLNRYLVNNPPEIKLNPSYCFPDNSSYYEKEVWKETYTRRLVALDKTREERGER